VIIQEFSKHQHVVPRWLGYKKSIELNELGQLSSVPLAAVQAEQFRNEIIEFQDSQSHRHGADLFERLLLANQDDLAQQIAPVIVAEKRLAEPIRNLARETLTKKGQALAEATNEEMIRVHKRLLRDQPRNGIRWVELARLYAIKRQHAKAYDALHVAIGLNPQDRYTVRSLIRFLLHINESKEASNVLGSNINSIKDPWLKGIGLSALMIAGRSPKAQLAGSPASFGKGQVFENSEFLAACGMLLLENGKDKNAKTYFRTAWGDPSANVTTHAEWLTRTLLPDLRSDALSLKRKTSEAKAGEAYSRADWSRMIEEVNEWILEEPYSAKPFRFLAQACNIRGKFEEAIDWIKKIEKIGRCDFGAKISKLYALLCLKRTVEAEEMLVEFDIESLVRSDKVLILANLGLLFIQKGSPDEGLSLYKRAEREAATFSQELASKVFINAMFATRISGKKLSEEDHRRLKNLASAFKHEVAVALLIKRIDPDLYQFEPPQEIVVGMV
jgi:tetratricopeptide (TPR) repeat protein